MLRTLVIGGTLFIGRALVRRLLERGDDVVILHRGRGTPFGEAVREIRCDRNDVDAVRAALHGERFDVVFDNVYDFERGTTAAHVEAAARAGAGGLRRYVFMSSIAAYGGGLDHDEEDALASPDHPNDYARNKAESERALFRMHAGSGFPAATLRPAFVYGPHNPMYRETFFWDLLRSGRPVVIPEDGERLMQFAHVEDVALAAILAAENDGASGRAYNVAGEPLSQVAYVRALARAAGTEPTLVHVPRERIEAVGGSLFRPNLYFGEYYDLPSLTVRTERVRRELGLEPTPLDDGLRETFLSYQATSAGAEPDFAWFDRLIASTR
jgi:nucleoside-diphosphate-sugar epimerase